MTEISPQARRTAPLANPNSLGSNATKDISAALTSLLADVFVLYLKTKNFHWHVSGPNFRSLHLMFDEHAGELQAMVDDVAERARKLGGPTLRSIGHIGRLQTLADNDADYVTPGDMVAELRDDNMQLINRMREVHAVCDEHNDYGTTSLLDGWIDEAEKRVWFLFETSRDSND